MELHTVVRLVIDFDGPEGPHSLLGGVIRSPKLPESVYVIGSLLQFENADGRSVHG